MAKKKGPSCTFVPQIQDEPSEMFTGLIDMHVERPLANYLYAKYIASNAAAKMDAAGFKRNEQGQHNAADVYKFFNVAAIQKAQGFSLSRIESKYGIVDNAGERVKFSAEDAYNKAKEINDNEVGHVAKVVKRGDTFTVVADKKDSRTQIWQGEVAGALVGWRTLQNGLRRAGIDVDGLTSEMPDLVNPMETRNFLSYVYSLRNRPIDSLTEKDIHLLLYTGEGSQLIANLATRNWGSKAEMAEKMYDILHNPSAYAQDTVNAVTNALEEAKKVNNNSFNAIYNDVKVSVENFHKGSESAAIEGVLVKLDKDFEINHTIIVRTDKTIKRLSDATAEAVLTLQRQLRYLQKQEGRTGEGLEVEKTLEDLTKELAGKQYYSGLLGFLSKANRYAVTVSNLLKSVSDNGNAMEYAISMGKALSKAVTFRDGYNTIIQALRNPEVLLIDENMSDAELSSLKDLAESIAKMMDRQKVLIEEMQEDLTLTVAQEILGSDSANGIPIAQLVKMGAADSSLMDFLYSCERVSDPIVASLGTVIRDAQRKRDRIASEFAARIEQANRIYKDSNDGNKGDTHFMYHEVQVTRIDWKTFNAERDAEKKRLREAGYSGVDFNNAYNAWYQAHTVDDGNGRRLPNDAYKIEDTQYYIKSNHNYEDYEHDKSAYATQLRKAGITGFAFNDAMEKWERDNTVEEIVDAKSGRTERVPDSKYDINPNGFDAYTVSWSDAQREYYRTMMQIKGEIGTLLPSYAQRQYLPPQRRASWLDILTEGKQRGLTAKQIAKNILNRMNFMKQKEDDTTFVEGGIIGERDSSRAYSNYDDTILRQVPIYYINPLRDQSDLLMDFSGAVQSLGAVAANYAVINGTQERTQGANDGIVGVREVVENMADYLKYRPIADRDANGKKRVDVAKWGQVIIGKILHKNAEKTLTSSIVDGFVAKHIYNEQLALGSEDSVLRKLQLAVRGLLGYTSVTALSVNVKGAVSNYLVGEYQMLFEGISGSAQRLFRGGRQTDQSEFYTLKDYARADAIMFGQGVRLGTVMDHLANTTGTLGHLLERRFDPLQEVYSDLGEKRYYSGLKKLIGGFDIMGMYSAGESLIHLHNMYAVLCNEKVLLDGKQVSLYDVFDKEMEPDGKNARLIIKQKATKLDGTAIDEAYLESVQARIRLINQKTHGSMNSEDKGMIHRFMMGRAAMQFKQWMVEHYSRRYRGRYFDGTTRTWQEGYYNTVYKLAKTWAADLLKLNIEANARWSTLDKTQRNNVTRAISELVCFAGLLGLSAAMGDPKDHKGEGLYRFLIYQLRRLIMDEEASIPPIIGVTGGVVKEGTTLAQTPFAFIKTVNGLLYPITGIGEAFDTYTQGRNKGKNKYLTKIKKNTIPFYGQIDQLLHMDNEDYVFNVFDNVAYNKGK